MPDKVRKADRREQELVEEPDLIPIQADLFSLLDHDDVNHEYSQLFLTYSLLPRWDNDYGDPEPGAVISRTYWDATEKVNYNITIQPGSIRVRKPDGTLAAKPAFPGNRERLVEATLLRIASLGGQHYQKVNGKKRAQLGVRFSIRDIQRHLAPRNRTLSTNEIREALDILSSSILTVSREDRTNEIRSTYLSNLSIPKPEAFRTTEAYEAKACFAVFYPLVTDQLIAMQFREYNYDMWARLSSPIAQSIANRMNARFIQAAPDLVYRFTARRHFDENGFSWPYRPVRAENRLKVAFEELMEKGYITDYKIERVRNSQRFTDFNCQAVPSERFTRDMKRSNAKVSRREVQMIARNNRTAVKK